MDEDNINIDEIEEIDEENTINESEVEPEWAKKWKADILKKITAIEKKQQKKEKEAAEIPVPPPPQPEVTVQELPTLEQTEQEEQPEKPKRKKKGLGFWF